MNQRPPPATVTLQPESRPRALTWRSLLTGLLGTVLICGLTPYNDFAMANTLMIGNFLPIGLVLILLTIVLLINAPLLLFAPRHALREGELAIALAMMLAACSLPSSGLMRYLPAGIVGIPVQGASNRDYMNVLRAVDLPRWLLPDLTTTDPNEFVNDPVIRNYRFRSPEGIVPWAAWVRPLAVWGAFVACLWGLMLCLSIIVRRQWTENERLAFPLASVYTALIESPEPGHGLNGLFRSKGFWIAAGAVFFVHGLNVLNMYQPRVPTIPIGYNLQANLTEPPWTFLDYGAKEASIYFALVGITYFLQARVSFSIWAFFVLWQCAKMVVEQQGIPFTEDMRGDQTFGGLIVFTAAVLYVGRQHWWLVLRQMLPFLRRSNDTREESRYLPYAVAGWGAVLCVAGLIAWLMAAGVSFLAALGMIAALAMVMMVVARIVAETGLIFVQINWQTYRGWFYPIELISPAARIDARSFFFAGWLSQLFHDLRESFAAFFQQGVRVADATAYERVHHWRPAFGLVAAVLVALVVGYCVSAASMLWVEYNYAEPMGMRAETIVSQYATEHAVRTRVFDPAIRYAGGNANDSPLAIGLNLGIGATIIAICSIGRLTLPWWPLSPIGFLVTYTYAGQKIWFSIFIGWLVKGILMRLGGSSLLLRVKPVFIGLIIGEAFAAAFWLVVSFLLNWVGSEYYRTLLLPG